MTQLTKGYITGILICLLALLIVFVIKKEDSKDVNKVKPAVFYVKKIDSFCNMEACVPAHPPQEGKY